MCGIMELRLDAGRKSGTVIQSPVRMEVFHLTIIIKAFGSVVFYIIFPKAKVFCNFMLNN